MKIQRHAPELPYMGMTANVFIYIYCLYTAVSDFWVLGIYHIDHCHSLKIYIYLNSFTFLSDRRSTTKYKYLFY